MPRPTRPLDVPPASLREAVDDLAKIANICLKAGLPNASRRCAVIADWLAKQRLQTVDLAALDAELLPLPIGTRVVPPVGGMQGPRSTFQPPAPAVPSGLHVNTDTEALNRVQAYLARLGPQRTADLAPMLGMKRTMAKQKLKRWRKAGHLTTVGVRAGSRWALPDPDPTRAIHVTVGSTARRPTVPTPAAPAAEDAATRRDQAILTQLKRLGAVGSEEKELVAHLPDEPNASTLPMTRLAGVLRRLLFKEQIKFEHGRYYVLKAA